MRNPNFASANARAKFWTPLAKYPESAPGAGMKEEMAELNTPFEQEQVGIVSERDQNVIEPPLLRKYMLQMSTQ